MMPSLRSQSLPCITSSTKAAYTLPKASSSPSCPVQLQQRHGEGDLHKEKEASSSLVSPPFLLISLSAHTGPRRNRSPELRSYPPMADSSSAPGGYYSGPPAAPHDKHKAPPSGPEPADGQVNASVPGGYYSGGPAANPGAGGGQGSAAPKEPGFFASCGVVSLYKHSMHYAEAAAAAAEQPQNQEAASPKPKGTCSTVYSHIPLPSIQEAEAGSRGGAPPASSSSLIVPLSPEEAARGRLAMADASGNPADGYYSGRPLGLEYDPQQAQAVPAPPLQAAQPQATAGEQANGVPAPQPQQPRQDVGEQVANHTHVHGVPGYYKARLSNTNTAVAPLSAAATVAPPPPAPAPADEPERKLSWIDKYLMCFTGGRNVR